MASNIPRDRALDSTLTLLSDGYEFIANKCQQLEKCCVEPFVSGRAFHC